MTSAPFIHPTASVSKEASIGAGATIWHSAQVREGAQIGAECILGHSVYIDAGVEVGDRCKIQNGVSIYRGVTLEEGVFCGPSCVFTNDLRPRAIGPDGALLRDEDWTLKTTLVKRGASLGANCTILCGLVIGRWAMVGAGAVVTGDVPDHGLVVGNPARLVGFVCSCGQRLADPDLQAAADEATCSQCGATLRLPGEARERLAGNLKGKL